MAEEKQFENKVKQFLKSKNIWFVKYWGGGSFTIAGVPDLLCCINGFFVGIELKAKNGKPSELQLHTINEIRKSSGYAFVLYPSAFDKFKDFINDLYCEKKDNCNEHIKLIWK